MLEQFLDFFIPKTHKTNKQIWRKSRLLVGFCFAVIFFSLGYAPFYLHLQSYISVSILLYGVVSAFLLLIWFYKTGQFTSSGHFFTFTSLMFFVFFSLITEGVNSITASWFIMTPVSATLLVNKKAGLFWTIVTVSFITTLYIFDILGFTFDITFNRSWLSLINFINLSGVVSFMLVIAWIYERGHEIVTDDLLKANENISQKNIILGEQNHEIQQQSEQLQTALTQITESLQYGQYIQRAILGSPKIVHTYFRDSFLFFKARDVVSGDFYWFTETEDFKIVVIADCTGHGVPGAFMTLIGYNLLNQIITEKGVTQPAEILTKLDKSVRNSLKDVSKHSIQIKDGMDISILKVNKKHLNLTFAGAKHHLYYLEDSKIIQIKGNPFPIGGDSYKSKKEFSQIEKDFQKGDRFYLFTDGFADQFGRENPKEKTRKYLRKNFKEFLELISQFPLDKQEEALEKELTTWKGNEVQTDDILVFGLKM